VKRSIVVVGGPIWLVKEVAQAAEKAGLHRVWQTEGTNSDAIVRALAADGNLQSAGRVFGRGGSGVIGEGAVEDMHGGA